MKHTTETMNRKPEEQMLRRCDDAKAKTLKPLPASVQGAPGETRPVAARKPA